jgi:hypothetical protein
MAKAYTMTAARKIALRKAQMASAAKRRGRSRSGPRPWERSGINAKVRRGVFRNKQGIMVGYSRELRAWVSIPD